MQGAEAYATIAFAVSSCQTFGSGKALKACAKTAQSYLLAKLLTGEPLLLRTVRPYINSEQTRLQEVMQGLISTPRMRERVKQALAKNRETLEMVPLCLAIGLDACVKTAQNLV